MHSGILIKKKRLFRRSQSSWLVLSQDFPFNMFEGQLYVVCGRSSARIIYFLFTTYEVKITRLETHILVLNGLKNFLFTND